MVSSRVSSAQRVFITVGILTGLALGALEATVVGTAMPTVVASLGGLEIYSWVFSAYLLTSTVTVPLWGKVSDIYGRRPSYILCIVFFAAGSIACGMAGSMAQLVIFRAVQGLGAGGLFSLGMTIIGELYSPVERARIQGYFSAVWGVASIAGPVTGGFLTDHLSWRWVFFINIPFAAAAAMIIGTQLAETVSKENLRRLDFRGIGFFTIAVTLFMLLLIRSETSFDLRSAASVGLLGGSALAACFFVISERRSSEPLLPVALFRNKIFAGAAVNAFLAGTAMFGLLSFIPLFVQGVQGTGATEAGSVLTPLLLGWVVCSAIGGRLLLRFTFRQVMLSGMILMTAGFFMLDFMTVETARSVVLRNALILGAGMGLSMITSMVAVQHSVPRMQLGIATSTAQFLRSIGSALGVAVMGTVLMQQMNRQMAESAAFANLRHLAENPDAFLQPAVRDSLPPELVATFQRMLANALHSVFMVGTVVCLLGLLLVWLIPSTRLDGPASESQQHPGAVPSREAS